MTTTTKRGRAHPGPYRFEQATMTIRAVPENYWLASMDSWDGAVDNIAHGHLFAASAQLRSALRKLLDWQKETRHAVPRVILEEANAALDKAEGKVP